MRCRIKKQRRKRSRRPSIFRIGHWEYRADMEEKFIARKTQTALEGDLGVILCIGETLEVSLSNVKMISDG